MAKESKKVELEVFVEGFNPDRVIYIKSTLANHWNWGGWAAFPPGKTPLILTEQNSMKSGEDKILRNSGVGVFYYDDTIEALRSRIEEAVTSANRGDCSVQLVSRG